MEKKIIPNEATDQPDSRDYTFEEYLKLKIEKEEASGNTVGWTKEQLEVQNQLQTPACTVFWATHIHNILNLLEDWRYGKTRTQSRANIFWDAFCKYRGYTNGGSSIQTVAGWFKKEKYISWYVSIPRDTPLDKMVLQMKQSIDMWLPIYSGSAFGAWSKIWKTGIYEDSLPNYFLWHAYAAAVDYVLKDDGTVDYFWAINSYWPKWWPFGWRFKIYAKDVGKLYTKIIFLDFDDKDVFAKLEEVEKLKQAIKLLREVYRLADKPVKDYFDKIQMWQNFSKLYNTTI